MFQNGGLLSKIKKNSFFKIIQHQFNINTHCYLKFAFNDNKHGFFFLSITKFELFVLKMCCYQNFKIRKENYQYVFRCRTFMKSSPCELRFSFHLR